MSSAVIIAGLCPLHSVCRCSGFPPDLLLRWRSRLLPRLARSTMRLRPIRGDSPARGTSMISFLRLRPFRHWLPMRHSDNLGSVKIECCFSGCAPAVVTESINSALLVRFWITRPDQHWCSWRKRITRAWWSASFHVEPKIHIVTFFAGLFLPHSLHLPSFHGCLRKRRR